MSLTENKLQTQVTQSEDRTCQFKAGIRNADSLAAMFGVSTRTIECRIAELCKAGLLRRIG